MQKDADGFPGMLTLLTRIGTHWQSAAMSNPNLLIQPYLFFGGRCEEALEFYRTALGAEMQMLMRYKESPEPNQAMPSCFDDKVMHTSFRVGATTLMASDGMCDGKANFEGFSLSITVPDEAEAERLCRARRGRAGNHASGEDLLGTEIWDASGSVRRRLDGFRNAQTRSGGITPLIDR